MTFVVRLTADALRDLEEIDDWIFANDSPARAAHVLDQIKAAIATLEHFPERGARPRELLAVGMREYRETFFKPYRIVYRVEGNQVIVYLVADGRRDMQSLLSARLLGAP